MASDGPKRVSSYRSWASSPGSRKTMQGNRKRDTKPEMALRRAVHGLGLRYRVCRVPVPTVRRSADLVFPRERIAVFLDGCFWHGCQVHTKPPRTNPDYWGPKIEGNRLRDLDTDQRLAAVGWLAVRIWEHEDPQVAAHHIQEVVHRRRAASKPGPR